MSSRPWSNVTPVSTQRHRIEVRRLGHAAGRGSARVGCRFPLSPIDYLHTTRVPDLAPTPVPEAPVKYLCLIYEDEKNWTKMPKEQSDAVMGEYFAFTENIKKSGQMLGGEALQPTQAATTVRVRGGKISTTDGPFAETKEQLGGYYLIDAKDLNDAIQVAAKIPSARFGSIEVRPLMEFNQQ